uniref:Uncharacterized protein n=1 Tax=Panagrolaimus sp. ES5 TaxID=591445 RepID=A0AC34FMF9_9BILA
MEMKWLYGIFALITFVTITNAAKNNIPRWYNNHRYRSPSSTNYNNNNNNNNNNREYNGGFGGIQPLQWRSQHQHQQPWKNEHYFFRQIKNARFCGKKLTGRVATVCGGCPPDGLTSIGKRSGGPDPKIVEACCMTQCGDDVIKTLACNECNI